MSVALVSETVEILQEICEQLVWSVVHVCYCICLTMKFFLTEII